MSLKKKLDRYRKHLKEESTKKQPSELAPDDLSSNQSFLNYNQDSVLNDRLLETCDQLKAVPAFYEDQFIFTKESHYPVTHKHGKISFSELEDAVSLWDELSIDHPLSTHDRKPTDLLFFDTETTGLGSGVGHMIFLLGTARYNKDGVKVKQYFLPGPGHEVAFYHHFLNDVDDLKNLVTFNGKAFDWPKVKTRHTMVRQLVPKLPSFGHYDLLHASRRLWKDRLSSTSLNMIEENILDVPRSNDVPGYMAPFLYFQFQKNPHHALVDGIFKHNEKDILTLISLYIQLSKIILKPHTASIQERYAVAKWYAYLKHDQRAIELFEDINDGDLVIDSKKYLIILYKRTKQYDHVLILIQSLLDEDKYVDIDILIEAAKIYEHHKRDYDYALYFTNKAYDLLEQRKLRGHAIGDVQNAILKRIIRLKFKGNK